MATPLGQLAPPPTPTLSPLPFLLFIYFIFLLSLIHFFFQHLIAEFAFDPSLFLLPDSDSFATETDEQMSPSRRN